MIIYNAIFDILNTYIYGSPEALTSFQELTLVQISTFLSVFVAFLPLIFILIILKFFIGTIGRF